VFMYLSGGSKFLVSNVNEIWGVWARVSRCRDHLFINEYNEAKINTYVL
jgi:hypothetical protein